MIRSDTFRISHKPYAVELGTLRVTRKEPASPGARLTFHISVRAVWYRRRAGRTMAVVGSLWDFQPTEPASLAEALMRHDDGRYGGAWVARWDGESYASEHPQDANAIKRHLALLRPMLANYSAVPPGYDGWWHF